MNAEDEDGITVLQAASAIGREAIVRLLLDHKADVNAASEYHRNALQVISVKGHEGSYACCSIKEQM